MTPPPPPPPQPTPVLEGAGALGEALPLGRSPLDLVLVESPPELDPVIPLVAEAGMVPPVAALIYAADQPRLELPPK